jgi:hypothetical protein
MIVSESLASFLRYTKGIFLGILKETRRIAASMALPWQNILFFRKKNKIPFTFLSVITKNKQPHVYSKFRI